MSSLLAPVMKCLGLSRKSRTRIDYEGSSYEPKYSDSEPDEEEFERAASRFVNILLRANTADPADLRLRDELKDAISSCGYYDRLAEWILHKLDDALRNGTALGKTVKEASEKAIEAAVGFAEEHPAYCTLIALVILVIVAPWILGILGFAELGPVEGSFAALWQARYAGYVPKGSLFSFFSTTWYGVALNSESIQQTGPCNASQLYDGRSRGTGALLALYVR